MKIYQKDGAVHVHVHVQPRASRSEVVGEHGGALKVRIAAAPVDGEANAELERFMARVAGVPAARVQVVSGTSSRRKVVAIAGKNVPAVAAALEQLLRGRQ